MVKGTGNPGNAVGGLELLSTTEGGNACSDYPESYCSVEWMLDADSMQRFTYSGLFYGIAHNLSPLSHSLGLV
jgi:hypothetical protein